MIESPLELPVLDRPAEAKPSVQDGRCSEAVCRERRLAELEIIRQGFEAKNRQLSELSQRLQVLEDLLGRCTAGPTAHPLPPPRSIPRRWSPH